MPVPMSVWPTVTVDSGLELPAGCCVPQPDSGPPNSFGAASMQPHPARQRRNATEIASVGRRKDSVKAGRWAVQRDHYNDHWHAEVTSVGSLDRPIGFAETFSNRRLPAWPWVGTGQCAYRQSDARPDVKAQVG
jgi:hypothetical protein